MKTLKNLFLDELADMYDSERRIAATWPKFIEATTSGKLHRALLYHLDETEKHAKKIERIFASFGEAPKIKDCPTMVSILNEGERVISEHLPSSAADEAIISVCQKVEHYEVASYATLRACSKSLGNAEATALIEEILEEEKDADRTMLSLESSLTKEYFEPVGAGV